MRTINLIGVGPGSPELVTRQAVLAMLSSDVIIGAKRALDTAEEAMQQAIAHGEKTENNGALEAAPAEENFRISDTGVAMLTSARTADIMNYITAHPKMKVVSTVFTGDTSIYSEAKALRAWLAHRKNTEPEAEQFEVLNYPGVSSIQYFLSKRGISMADVHLVSLHGQQRDVIPVIRENQFVCVLLGDEENAARIAKRLVQFGLNDIKITIGERLSFPDEDFTTGSPREIRKQKFDRMAIALFENDNFRHPIKSFGIGDDKFFEDEPIQVTSRDVRALSLCRLTLHDNSIVYDIGAGTGSVSVEAALSCPEGKVFAVECNEDAAMLIERNRYKFQIDNICVVRGVAPACLKNPEDPKGFPTPDAVFIGGMRSRENLSEIVDWAIGENPHVIIVINSETLEAMSEILKIEKRLTDYQFEMVEISSTSLERRGSFHTYRAEDPVTITRISHR
ncbi:MAG: precorrin-6Y C5,15-methyltransferase (decarboxylating) subunit CbiT [Oribacterium sp.]|jgi:precorrin-6Y C5,15-methyltransferase (decarboxylating)|nr:precorrin-6Y C5,15-methyltransferase (decarboxylating) subunit CbiT [Oribacterium sp.]